MNKNNNKLSLEPYKGTRDFYPEDMFLQKYIFSVMKKVVESYGYQEYNASLLEETDLYRAKSGEEIVNEQTYSFKDRGGRDITLRPEMTPTAARMAARKRKQLIFPLRWYSIPNMFRYEKPQRGRLREHWQLNVDIFGVEGIEAEKELIEVSYNIMKEYGIADNQFIIKINNRRLVNYFLGDYLKLNKDQKYKASKLIDKKLKMKEKDFKAGIEDIVKDKDKAKKMIKFLSSKNPLEIEKILGANPPLNPPLARGENNKEDTGLAEIKKVISDLEKRGLKNIVFDPSLMRGFDYYTGIVFEVFDMNPKNNRALFGGGRYDDLVGIFDVEKVSGVGFGMGDVTIKDALETYGLLPDYSSQSDIYVCVLDLKYIDYANKFAAGLRKKGVNVELDLTNKKIGAQIKTADKKKIQFVVCIGENEVKSKKFKLKRMKDGKEFLLDSSGIAEVLNK